MFFIVINGFMNASILNVEIIGFYWFTPY